ncbi:VanZ family protein [Rhodocytophaga rosea]|uniref:VanZ family protein n=1 Tax=Rhodocytophaga rosea TaxID=2704465 RepID=A0A6C0GTI8_9BACT|nr:VanZ family protein [Rhodocytophaga rosea]QHT71479.1 VanZ family protein [Rhodocytophaga rosea]
MEERLKDSKVSNRWTTLLFIIYLIALYYILLLKLGIRFSYMRERITNFIPFSEGIIFTSEKIMNVVIFLPLGIYAGILFERWIFATKLLLFFSLSLFIEALQYILRIGAFDVTDLITNTTGAVTGVMLFEGLDKAFNNRCKAQKLINLLAAASTVIMIVVLVLLKMNRLPIRYQ